MVETAATFQVGDKLHQYELVAVLGRGGHAVVFHGFDRASDRHVAIKVLHDAKHDLRERARAEGRLLISLRHPNLIEVYDAGVTERGSVYIVMERLEGRSLRALSARLRKLSVVEALPIGIQIARGVLAAHARRVVHRDLKPDNIFVLPDGTIKVLDFGIAKYLEQSFHTTQKRILQGTPSYMAPEQFQGLPVSYRTDVFALGVVLYELIAGVKPSQVDGEPKNIDDFVKRQLVEEAPPLHELVPGVPPGISDMIGRALRKRAEDRFDLEEFLERMERELELARKRSGNVPPRDLVRACLDLTEPDCAPEFTALSQRITDRVNVRTPEETQGGAGTGRGHDMQTHVEPSRLWSARMGGPEDSLSREFVTERLFEGEPTSVTRTLAKAVPVPPAEIGTHPPLTGDVRLRLPLVSNRGWLALGLLLVFGAGATLRMVFFAPAPRTPDPVLASPASPPPKSEASTHSEVREPPAPERVLPPALEEKAPVARASEEASTPPNTQSRATSRERPRAKAVHAATRARPNDWQKHSLVKTDPALLVGSGLPEPAEASAQPGSLFLD